jgi:5-methylcytosine-specific restriction enzyme A
MADWPYNTNQWQRLRRAHLSIEPLCRGCQAIGKIVRANTVDHVKAISDGGPAFPGHDGLASYCPSCHSAKTARGTEAGAFNSTKPRKGCDANGNPLDPAHPWAEKSLGAKGLRPRWNLQNQLVSKGNL